MENKHFLFKLNQIFAFVFDVDGVFTNNQLIASENGLFIFNNVVK